MPKQKEERREGNTKNTRDVVIQCSTMIVGELRKLIRRRKRRLTVAPMPLPEAIPVHFADIAAIFVEFDVPTNNGPTIHSEDEERDDGVL